MIKLDIMPYCQECPDFEAHVDKNEETQTFTAPMGHSKGFGLVPDVKVIHRCNTTVMCKHHNKCRCIMEHLSEEQKKKQSIKTNQE